MVPEVNRLPRLVIAAPQGRSGKTTVTLGLCAALRARGLTVQPYKKGPDYIDPSWLSEAAGCACRSLDPFFYDQPEDLRAAFARSARRADISLIEGNHGIFDSFDETGVGSTAAVARTLDAPILLVVNATRVGRSVAAIVHGCQTFEAGTNIAGVVLNNVAQGRHEARMRTAIESHCNIPVVGAIPRDERLTIPDRHLGLVPRGEGETLLSAITTCQQAIERYLDLDLVLRIASSVSPLPASDDLGGISSRPTDSHPKIGVMRDRAFTFYYPENLEALEEAGAELVFVNAFTDATLPDLDALYIGGGFPEIFMDELSANAAMRTSVRQAIERGLPVYAECGGMMYLSRRIVWGEKSAEMVGVLPCEIEMTNKPQGHGYVTAKVDAENPFFPMGTVLRGHEFHNSRAAADSSKTAYRLLRGNGLGGGRDGFVLHNVLASYTHLHVGGCAVWAEGLVKRARLYRESRQDSESSTFGVHA
ncbi:MAG: cobyrinate a,c-diamide synthase [Anaerolineaceae bacterium]|nr:MAG: cobyrinate a,c-diamide synthase [Anaerolineaceae bacterium]